MEECAMNDNLSCGLVRDLLPSYLEGLTSRETNEAVEAHLKTCGACARALEAMREEPRAEEERRESRREVDYLRQVKRRSRRRILLAVLATAAGLLAALLLKVFVIGTPLQAQTLAVDAREDNGRLCLKLMSMGSGNAYHGWKVEIRDGVACVYARDVLVGLFRDGGGTVYVSLEGVEEVWLGGTSPAGRLVWQDGVVIGQTAAELSRLKTPYCGDPTALGDIARALRIQETLGSFTISMDTAKPPYRWTLRFERTPGGDPEVFRAEMERCAAVMLALVENLDEVAWEWPEGAGLLYRDTAGRHLRERAEEITYEREKYLKDSVKDYSRTAADLQRMLELLGSY